MDDDPGILELYRLMSEGEDTWDVSLASGGREALAMIKWQPFDVVVSDMRMPGMTGAELLQEVVRMQPQASRILVSGYADHEQVAHCLQATHQFISKPFEIQKLKATISRIVALDRLLLGEKLKEVVGRIDTVPSLPSLYFRIVKALASQAATIEQIAGIVAQDPAMTAKVLQLVNSAFFGLARRIVSPTEAIQYLGVRRVRSLALSLHIFTCFDQVRLEHLSLERVWEHSLTTGLLARKIVRAAGGDRHAQDEAYVAGMLHDIGKVMLASDLPQEFERAIEIAIESRIPMIEAERQVFGVTHAEVGAYLLGLWGLPVAIVEAVAMHHKPIAIGADQPSPLAAVHVANVLENELKCSEVGIPQSTVDNSFLSEIGYDRAMESWRALALEAVDEVTVV